jgi:hypothetical protein
MSEADPIRLTAIRFPFSSSGVENIFSDNENVLEAVDDNADGFDVCYSGDGEIEHGWQVGVGDVDVAAGNRLGHNAAAVEVNRFDMTPCLSQSFCFSMTRRRSEVMPDPL